YTQWARFYPSAANSSLYACLTRDESHLPKDELRQTEADSVKSILAAPQSERESLMQSYLSRQITKVLGLSVSNAAERNARLNVNQPLNRLGMDSLMALEIKNLIEKSLNATVPISSLLDGSSLADLTKLVLDQLSDSLLASHELFGLIERTDLRPNGYVEEVQKEGDFTADIETDFLTDTSEFGGPEWEEMTI